MKRSAALSLMLIVLIASLAIETEAGRISPQWYANMKRQQAYDPTMLWWPFTSKLWKVSPFIYFYLFFMALFNRHDLVVQFFNDLTETYYPMTGIT